MCPPPSLGDLEELLLLTSSDKESRQEESPELWQSLPAAGRTHSVFPRRGAPSGMRGVQGASAGRSTMSQTLPVIPRPFPPPVATRREQAHPIPSLPTAFPGLFKHRLNVGFAASTEHREGTKYPKGRSRRGTQQFPAAAGGCSPFTHGSFFPGTRGAPGITRRRSVRSELSRKGMRAGCSKHGSCSPHPRGHGDRVSQPRRWTRAAFRAPQE